MINFDNFSQSNRLHPKLRKVITVQIILRQIHRSPAPTNIHHSRINIRRVHCQAKLATWMHYEHMLIRRAVAWDIIPRNRYMLKSIQTQSRKFLVQRTIFRGDQVLRRNQTILNAIVHNRLCKCQLMKAS